MKRILVPVDFSSTSRKAFRFALQLATATKGTVLLYHVQELLENPYIANPAERRRYNQQQSARLLQQLQQWHRKDTATYPAVPVSCLLGKMPVVKTILQAAVDNQADVIVMGTQGATGIQRVVVGSVAARLAEQATVPVLLVPARYRLKQPESIAFAGEPGRASIQNLYSALQLAQPFGARLQLVHLVQKEEDPAQQQKENEALHTYVTDLQKQLRYKSITAVGIRTTNVVHTLEYLPRKVAYDVLVMVRRNKTYLQRLYLKSFTKSMAYITTRPLLILPES
jgi:nucleotide-binding universal stress UspA family protein